MEKILVVDDDKPTREALRAMLEVSGYEIIEAENGEEGLSLYRQELPDLVIIDLIMPEKEGIETIRELKRDFPEAKVFAISGSGFEYLLAASEFGALRTFMKPLHKDEIVAAVKDELV